MHADASLTAANLTYADFTLARLGRAGLAYTNLTGANLAGTGLAGAELGRARWPGGEPVSKGWMVDGDSGRLKRAGGLSEVTVGFDLLSGG